MSEKWEIKPVGANELSVKLPDDLELDQAATGLSPTELAAFMVAWVANHETEAAECMKVGCVGKGSCVGIKVS